jgi:NAD(P)H-hydrate epimerase
MRVSSVAEMRALDREAIEGFGIPEEILMENAGEAACEVLNREVGVAGKRVVILCGVGNNGGDGFVVARLLHAAGAAVKVVTVGDENRLRGGALKNREILSRLPIKVETLLEIGPLTAEFAACDVIVDALLGTGLSRPPADLQFEVIERINDSGKTVLSLDVPSGVHGDTGAVVGTSVRAALTVTFGLPKRGNLLWPGFGRCGKQYVSPLSFPPSMIEAADLQVSVNDPLPLPPRAPQGHKGTFGDTLFIAGAGSYFGAPYLAAMSFLRAGGGYARLAAPASMTPFLANKGSEIVFAPQQETPTGSIALANKAALLELARRVDFVVLGPGLSLDSESQQLARELAGGVDKPLLIDGDGITALCGEPSILTARQAPTILTPHAGEMARLTGNAVGEVEADRIAIVQKTAARLGAFIVLKGAHSLVGAPEGQVFINLSGNSGMATPGSGDVLTGAIAAMSGLGLGIPEATRMGVLMHGLAGDLAAADIGADGLAASDILRMLPAAMRQARDGGPWDARYTGPLRV